MKTSPAARKPLAMRLLVPLAGVLAALPLAEVISRLAPAAPPPVVTVRDSETGFRAPPGIEGVWTLENRARFKFNSLGYRDGEWGALPVKSHRIAMLGDSFVEALQVEADESFPNLLEARLGNAEVMNLGINGYGQVEELLTYRHVARPFKPDLVVLCFFPGNDPPNNWERRKPTPDYPVSVAAVSNGVTVTPNPGAGRISPARSAFEWLLARSSLFRRMDQARKSTMHLRLPDHVANGVWRGAFGNSGHAVRDFDPIWDLTEKLILQIAGEVAVDTGRADRFLVVALTTAFQVQERERAELLGRDPSLDPDYAEKRLAGYCASRGIPFLSLGPEMRRFNQHSGRNVHGFAGRDGHYNPDGHRIAAAAIGTRLSAMLTTGQPALTPPPPAPRP